LLDKTGIAWATSMLIKKKGVHLNHMELRDEIEKTEYLNFKNSFQEVLC
jgi:hypothetical protein